MPSPPGFDDGFSNDLRSSTRTFFLELRYPWRP